MFGNVGKSTVASIFTRFVDGVSRFLFPAVVTAPGGTQLQETLKTYEKLGFPGCIGSIDCTHIGWDRCPEQVFNFMKGKEGYPSFSFQVVVDHNRRVLWCSAG